MDPLLDTLFQTLKVAYNNIPLETPLNPAALDGQDAPLTPEHSSVTALPFVSQSDEE